MDHEEEGEDLIVEEVGLIVEEEGLMVEEEEVDMVVVDLTVEGVDMDMMGDEVDMEVGEVTGIEEVMVVEEDMEEEVAEGMAHQEVEEVDLQPEEEDDMVQDQDQGRDHQSERQREEIVPNTVVKGDILLPDPDQFRVEAGVEVGLEVQHQGGRRASVGALAGQEVRLGERGVILEVSAGVGLDPGVGVGRLCLKSKIRFGRGVDKRSYQCDIVCACR